MHRTVLNTLLYNFHRIKKDSLFLIEEAVFFSPLTILKQISNISQNQKEYGIFILKALAVCPSIG